MAVYKITMEDGTQESVTLGMGALAELSRRTPDLYQRYRSLYRKLGAGEDIDELEMAEIIYIAYRAANPNKDCMSMDEFFEHMSDDREAMGSVFMLLFGVREKKQGSVMPSGRPHGKGRGRR